MTRTVWTTAGAYYESGARAAWDNVGAVQENVSGGGSTAIAIGGKSMSWSRGVASPAGAVNNAATTRWTTRARSGIAGQASLGGNGRAIGRSVMAIAGAARGAANGRASARGGLGTAGLVALAATGRTASHARGRIAGGVTAVLRSAARARMSLANPGSAILLALTLVGASRSHAGVAIRGVAGMAMRTAGVAMLRAAPAATMAGALFGRARAWGRALASLLLPASPIVDPAFIARGTRPQLVAVLAPALTANAPRPSFMATHMQAVTNFGPALAAGVESRWLTFDFAAMGNIGPSVTLTGCAASVSVVSGTDSSPSSRILQGPTLAPAPSMPGSVLNQAVLVLFGKGPGPVTWKIQIACTASDGSSPSMEATIGSYLP